jgi:hypothetical protein
MSKPPEKSSLKVADGIIRGDAKKAEAVIENDERASG